MEEQHEKDVSDATGSGCEVYALLATGGSKKELGFRRRRRYCVMMTNMPKCLKLFFLQSLLKGAPFNTASTNSPRVRILPARKNGEVRECLNKSDTFQLTSPNSLLPYWGKRLKPTRHHQRRSQGWGDVFVYTGKGKPSTCHERRGTR